MLLTSHIGARMVPDFSGLSGTMQMRLETLPVPTGPSAPVRLRVAEILILLMA